MKTRNFILALAAIASFASCQKENAINESEGVVVNFVAEKPDTKTQMVVVDNTATFDWTNKDETTDGWFHIFNNNVEATSVIQGIVSNKMNIIAEFSSIVGTEFTGYMNGTVKTAQKATNSSYDETSDVLIAKATATASEIENGVPFKFKRITATSLMTLDDMTNGETISKVVLCSDKAIAGTYDLANSTWKNTKNSITLTCGDAGQVVANNKITLWLMTIPVTSAQFTVYAYTSTGKVYGKKFNGKITLAEGSVVPYTVGVAEVDNVAIDLSTDNTTTVTSTSMTWETPLFDIAAAKASSSTATDNYYPSTPNQSYKSTRFYKNSTLTITPKNGKSISKIVYGATSDGYATALAGSTYTNAIGAANASEVTITPTLGTSAVSITIGATTGAEIIKVFFGTPITVLSAPSSLTWTQSTKVLSWTDANSGNGTYGTDYKYQYSTNGTDYSDTDNATSINLSTIISETTTVYVKAVAINTAGYADSSAGSKLCALGESVYKTASFLKSNNSKGVTTYTDSFSSTTDGFKVNLQNFNNNNNGWDYVKAGRKSNASVATITTASAIDKAITKVAVTIDAITTTKINSIKLYSGTSSSSITTEVGSFTKGVGKKEITISSPTQNLFYKLEFDCDSGSSNGLVTVSKVEFFID